MKTEHASLDVMGVFTQSDAMLLLPLPRCGLWETRSIWGEGEFLKLYPSSRRSREQGRKPVGRLTPLPLLNKGGDGLGRRSNETRTAETGPSDRDANQRNVGTSDGLT